MRRWEVNIQLQLENGTSLAFSTISDTVYNMLTKTLTSGRAGTRRLHLLIYCQNQRKEENHRAES